MLDYLNLGLNNFSFFLVGITSAGMLILGFSVLINNINNYVNRTFFALTIVATFWGIINYLAYESYNPYVSLWLFMM
jgi:hypothetical protein